MTYQYRNPKHWRSPKNLTLNDVLPDWDGGHGVFGYLNDSTTVPWSGISATGLDFSYHGFRSGSKYIAPILYKYLSDGGELTSTGISKIVTAIQARFYSKWSHLWEIYMTEYNPLDTYSYTETGNKTGSSSGTSSDTRTPNLTTKDVLDQDDTDSHTTSNKYDYGEDIDVTTSTTHGLKTEGSTTDNRTTDDLIYGFNSADPVNHSKSVVAGSGSSVTENSGTDRTTSGEEHSGSDNETGTVSGTNTRDSTNTRTETGTDKTDRTESESNSQQHTITRTGNIGRAPAELLEIDREFWMDDYFAVVFADLDEILTLAVYSESDPIRSVF